MTSTVIQLTVHRPISSAAADEAWECFRPAASFRHIANDEPMSKSDLDVALGLSLLTRSSAGRRELAGQLSRPADDPICGLTGPVGPAEREGLVRRMTTEAQTGRAAIEAMTKLFQVGVDAATGWSFSALEVYAIAGNS